MRPRRLKLRPKANGLAGRRRSVVASQFVYWYLKSILLHISHNRSDLKYLQRQSLKRSQLKLRLMTSTPPPSKRKPLERSL